MNNHKHSKKESPSLTSLPEDAVTLNSILGIPPIIYVPLCFLIVCTTIIVILFLFIFHPGTSKIHITTTPSNAAVYIDNSYLGVTPLTAHIENINHSIHIEKLGFKQKTPIQYSKRNLFSNIIGYTTHDILILQDPKTIVEYTVSRIAAYANTISTRKYTVPSTFNTTIEELLPLLEITDTQTNNETYDTKTLSSTEKTYALLLQIIYFSLPYLQDKLLYQKNIEHITEHYPTLKQAIIKKNIPSYIQDSKNINMQDILKMIEFYLAHPIVSSIKQPPPLKNKTDTLRGNTTQNKIHVLNEEFIFIPYQRLEYTLQSYLEYQEIYQSSIDDTKSQVLEFKEAVKNNSNDSISIQSGKFYIQSKQVTVQQYIEFLQNSTHWQTISAQKVGSEHSDNHLTLSNYHTYDASSPVTHITWYDAHAYVQWFNALLIEKGIQYRAKLPNEFEWRVAQQYIGSQNYELTIKKKSVDTSILSLYDDIWEWTDSWYSPLPHYNAYYTPSLGREKIVLGGNYRKNITTHGTLNTFLSRNNALDPTWASEYTSFRIILVSL